MAGSEAILFLFLQLFEPIALGLAVSDGIALTLVDDSVVQHIAERRHRNRAASNVLCDALPLAVGEPRDDAGNEIIRDQAGAEYNEE